MATIEYSAEVPSEAQLDQPVYAAQQERPDQPIKLRIQPTLLRVPAGSTRSNHQAWTGLSWNLDCATAAEAIAVRKALAAFFAAIGAEGPEVVRQALTPLGPKS